MILKTWLSFLFVILVLTLPGEISSEYRVFDQDVLEAYRSDSAFDYTSDYDKSGAWFTLLMIYLLEFFARLFNVGEVAWVIPIVFRILGVLIILAVIYYIFKNRFGSLVIRESKMQRSAPTISIGVNDIQDLHKLQRESAVKGDFKLAIRYTFLITLKALHEASAIKLTSWKAPLDYLDEIKESKKEDFQLLIQLFEQTWYGEYLADEGAYEKVLKHSKNLSNE